MRDVSADLQAQGQGYRLKISGFLMGSMKYGTVLNSGACSKVSTATLQQPRSLSANLHVPFFRDKDFKAPSDQGEGGPRI
jgi:hypothetical protein